MENYNLSLVQEAQEKRHNEKSLKLSILVAFLFSSGVLIKTFQTHSPTFQKCFMGYYHIT